MIELQNKIIDDLIPRIKFACNLSVCKGACCTLTGGAGAPLLDEEIEEIRKSYPMVKPILPKEHVETIEEYGLYEGYYGNYTTMCFNNRACVFVFYENDIAKCSFEKAYNEGKIKWRKPLSCHLFPIRVDRGFTERLRYEKISECNPALERGNQEQIFLSDFLMEPLIRAFGSDWYKDFKIICEWERNNPHSA